MHKWSLIKVKRDQKIKEKKNLLEQMDRLQQLVYYSHAGLIIQKFWDVYAYIREERRQKMLAVMTAVKAFCKFGSKIKRNGPTRDERHRRLTLDSLTFLGVVKQVNLLPKITEKFVSFVRKMAVATERKVKFQTFIGRIIRLQKMFRNRLTNKRARKQAILDQINFYIDGKKEKEKESVLSKKKPLPNTAKRIQWPLLTA